MGNEDKIKTQLLYKEHGEFFNDYFTIRRNAFVLLAKSISNTKNITDLYEGVITLIDFTSNYIEDISSIDAMIKEIDVLMSARDNKKALIKFREVLRLINKKHEESDVLPQKNIDDRKFSHFWRDEEHRAIRALKKGYHDIFMLK